MSNYLYYAVVVGYLVTFVSSRLRESILSFDKEEEARVREAVFKRRDYHAAYRARRNTKSAGVIREGEVQRLENKRKGDVQDAHDDATIDRVSKRVLEYIERHDGCRRGAITRGIRGDPTMVFRALLRLIKVEMITERENVLKGDWGEKTFFTYHVKPVGQEDKT
jgi:hypothetical protein